ncbi:MAG: hypothetical protein R3E39_31125 [Anaerolineae bacterium]
MKKSFKRLFIIAIIVVTLVITALPVSANWTASITGGDTTSSYMTNSLPSRCGSSC